MSRPSRYVWFGRPTPGGSISTDAINTPSKPRSKTAGLRELAVVFEDIPTYRRYKPGTGPPLAPITLLPVRDTTAYIREEFFVPPAFSVGGKKRLLYIVGWTDLPAARLQVDAERICDYVSPRAYEEWCAARAAERDEQERRIEEEENVRAVEEAEAREKGIFKSSRGRKRKQPVVDKASTPPPKTNGEKKRLGRPRKDAPSLSMPSKSMALRELEALDEDGDVDMDEAIFRQLIGEEPMSTEGSYDSGERSSVPARLEPSTKKRRTKSPRPTLSKLLPGIETDSSRSTPFDSSRGGTSSPALPPLPKPHTASRPAQPRETPILPPVPPASILQTSTPTAPRTKTQPPRRSLLSIRDPPSTPLKPTSEAQTPTPKAQRIPLRAPATAPPATNLPFKDSAATSHSPTPGSSFTPLIQSTTPWTISLAAAKNFANLTPSQPIRSIEQASSSTPKPRLPKPATRDPASPLKASQSAPPATIAGSTQAIARTLPAQEEQDGPEDNIYEVLRLEGVQERIVRGKRVRFFHVRWKGAWPPGQNPTWEPEANIPRSLIKKYLLAHPQQVHKKGAMDKYLVPSWPYRKYSSVSEAFEGGGADDATGGHGHDDGGEEAIEDGGVEEEDIGNEMLLVTDEPAQPTKPTLSW